ncbi:MAG: glycosyltransferase family 39 protein [Ardenticatenaceae bacterium]|nr:glycosyltransferase family 39 protein [Ardenticatenaceae bacterium]
MKDEGRCRGAGEQGSKGASLLLPCALAPLLLLLAFALRLPGLFANTFDADEALFATWARYIATWRDPLLLTQAVDKPPLAIYLQALFYPLFGPVEWAARLPNFIAFLLLIPLTARLARRLYPSTIHHSPFTTHHLPLLFLTLSPFAIQFSPTAYLDPLLVTLLTASLAARKPGWSGLFFGLALATKYQALLFLPLLLMLNWLLGWRWADWRRWMLALAPILALLLVWDVARTGTFSLWGAQMSNYGGLRLIWSWELLPRLWAWLAVARYGWGSTAVALLFLILSLKMGGEALAKTPNKGFGASQDPSFSKKRPLPTSEDPFFLRDIALLLFLAGYFLLHWLTAVPIWERYLLPLLPLVAALVGRMFQRLEIRDWRLSANLQSLISNLPFLLLMGLLLAPAWNAAHGRYPIGGQPTADDGAADIAAYLSNAPYGTVLYDHWYSWQWRYHFFDKGVYVNWVPHPAALADDLTTFGHNGQPRYLALPADATAQPFQHAVQQSGFHLTPVATSGTITLYQIDD